MLAVKHLSLLLIFSTLTLSPLYGQDQQSAEIIIAGADNELSSNIRNYLRIGAESCDTPLSRLNRLGPQVRTNIRDAANALGYYRSTFTLGFSEVENCWQLLVTITPRDRIPVNNVSIHISGSIEDQEYFQSILAENPALHGAPLHHGEYESIKSTLSARAGENGYFTARFLRSEIQIDLSAYEAGISIDFEPGARYSFGEITIEPVPGFSTEFINSLVILKSGEPYSSERLLSQRNNLDESRYFRQVNVSPQLSQANQEAVPVIISLVPRARNAWSTGIGFTTDTGPRVRAAYENRYINTIGHHLNSDLALSPVRSQINVGYVIPLSDPVKESVSIGTGYVTESTDTFDSDRFKIETAYRRESDSGWLETYSIDFLRDDFTIDLQQDIVTLTMLGFSLSKTQADDLIFPSKGWHLFGQVRGASDAIVSDTTFVQFYGSAKGIINFGPGRFLGKLELGSTWIEDPVDLPASVRFFAGGDQSLRGYKYRSLGPVNANNEVIGGEHLLTGSVEYDFPVKNNWRGAVFFDGGNAFSNQEFDWKQSVGVGMRWLSPIGPIRVDLAHAMSDDGGMRLHITMGPDL